jgi:hypothetical protein
MTDQCASFMLHLFLEFMASMKIKVLNSSPYYAQANGQVESSNKTLLKIIKKEDRRISQKVARGVIRGVMGAQNIEARCD